MFSSRRFWPHRLGTAGRRVCIGQYFRL